VTGAPTAAVPIGSERDFAICSRLGRRKTPAAGTLAGVRTGAGHPSNVGSIPGKDWRGLSSAQRPDQLWGRTQPPLLRLTGYLFPVVKRPRREADHSPPYNTG
jgi:hypothetical protein